MSIVTRQPRFCNPRNEARIAVTALSTKNQHTVQLKKTDGTWLDAVKVNTLARAQSIFDNLNLIFTAYPNADLDFITPGYDMSSGRYIVIWSGVVWDNSICTALVDGAATFEHLYKGCYIYHSDRMSDNRAFKDKSGQVVIAAVTREDQSALKLDPWVIALQWANNIRSAVNGWNCTKDATGGELIHNGYINNLVTPDAKWDGSAVSVKAECYGAGEKHPNFASANGDIFHTCDLTGAMPQKSKWPLDKWVKVSYNNKSVVARITDESNNDAMDLTSGGVAFALGFKEGKVTISAP